MQRGRGLTETHLIEIERVRSEAARHLAEHEIACEQRYGKLQAQLTKIEALHNRNRRVSGPGPRDRHKRPRE